MSRRHSSFFALALIGTFLSLGTQSAHAQTSFGSASDDERVSFRQCRIGAAKTSAQCSVSIGSENDALVLTIGQTTVTCSEGLAEFSAEAAKLSRTPVTRGNGASASLDCGDAKVMFTRVFQIDVNRAEDVLAISSTGVELAAADADDDSAGAGAVMIRMMPAETARFLGALNAAIAR